MLILTKIWDNEKPASVTRNWASEGHMWQLKAYCYVQQCWKRFDWGGGGGGEGKGNFKFVPKNAERLIIRQRFPVQLCARSGRGGKINPVNTKKQNTPTTSSQNVAFP